MTTEERLRNLDHLNAHNAALVAAAGDSCPAWLAAMGQLDVDHAIAMENGNVMRFWVSWFYMDGDCRPLTYPQHGAVIGWWKTGDREDGAQSIVALVETTDQDTAVITIKHEWPNVVEWRFIKPVAMNWLPGDRFPLSELMRQRLDGGCLKFETGGLKERDK